MKNLSCIWLWKIFILNVHEQLEIVEHEVISEFILCYVWMSKVNLSRINQDFINFANFLWKIFSWFYFLSPPRIDKYHSHITILIRETDWRIQSIRTGQRKVEKRQTTYDLIETSVYDEWQVTNMNTSTRHMSTIRDSDTRNPYVVLELV